MGGRELLGLTLGLDVADDLDPRAAVLMLQDEWVRLASELVSTGVAVLVVEDLHWAAEPLLELLGRLRSEVDGPLLLVATSRPDPGRDVPEDLILQPLINDEAEELLDRSIGAPLDAAARELILRHGEGNPFFLEELLSDLLERGLLERRNGGWSLRETGAALAVPDTVQGVLAGRVDTLASEAKEALLAAAVIGRSFTPAGLATLVGSAAEVRTLVERGFVRPTEPELVFKHALTREVAYSALPKVKRAQLHAAYATWLEGEDAGDGHAGALAYHYAEAAAPKIADLAWRDRDDEAARLRVSALHWLRRAAEVSLARFDLDDVLSHLGRAAELGHPTTSISGTRLGR